MDGQERVDMGAGEAKGKAARTRRRPGVKAPSENAKRSLNLRIDEESYRRLSIHALMSDRTISDLVMEFAQGLREYSMPHRLGGGAAKAEAGS